MTLIIGWILWISSWQVSQRVPPPSAAATAAIEGNVVQAGTNEPVAGAVVSLTPLGAARSGTRGTNPTAVADRDGRFLFRAVEPGQYTMSAARDGYRNPTSPGPLVILADRQQLTNMVLRLTRVPAISGFVSNPLGEPLAAATVQAYRAQFTPFGRKLTFVKRVLTNDLGEYRLFWLDPGDYTVAASYGQHAIRPAEVVLTPNLAKPDDGYATFYYPEALTPHEAQPVRVNGGVDTASINITFQDVPLFTISGRVLFPPNEEPVSDIRLAFESTGVDPGPELNYPITTDSQNAFEVRGVTPGSYFIVGTGIGKSGRLFSDIIGVNVGNQNVKSLSIPLFVTTTVSGNIFISDGVSTAADLIGLKVNLVRSDGQPGPRPSAIGMARGEFTIPSIPAGDYDVFVYPLPPGAYVDTIRLGLRSSSPQGGVRIDTSSSPGNLAVGLSFSGANVNGRAIDIMGKSMSGAQVVLIPEARFRKRPDRYLLGVTDSSGNFSISGVPPGNYSAFAFERVEAGIYYDPEFIQRLIGQSVAISVSKGGLVTLELKVVSADETGGRSQ